MCFFSDFPTPLSLASATQMSDFDTGPLVKQKQERRKNLRQGQRHVRPGIKGVHDADGDLRGIPASALLLVANSY